MWRVGYLHSPTASARPPETLGVYAGLCPGAVTISGAGAGAPGGRDGDRGDRGRGPRGRGPRGRGELPPGSSRPARYAPWISAEVYGSTEIYVHHSARRLPLNRELPRYPGEARPACRLCAPRRRLSLMRAPAALVAYAPRRRQADRTRPGRNTLSLWCWARDGARRLSCARAIQLSSRTNAGRYAGTRQEALMPLP
jgi:hypothetical protein